MAYIPTENALRSAVGLIQDGFTFIQKRRQRYRSDIFQIDAFGLKTFAFGGEAAAALFYDPDKFVRKGAVPITVQKSLVGVNAIHTTDGEEHRQRKAMFLSLMNEESIEYLKWLIQIELEHAVQKWKNKDVVVLFNESAEVLFRAISTWSALPFQDKDVPKITDDLVSMVDAFGSMGPRNWRGIRARNRMEGWVKKIIREVRKNNIKPKKGTALYAAAFQRDLKGKYLSEYLAAVELLNIIRPTVAIAWYIVFGATAFHQFPETRLKYLNNIEYRNWFVNEVRRYYPFAPFMGARVKKDFTWKGIQFPKGRMVLLDMYGTNHDGRLWERPEEFIPERFETKSVRPFDFLAQGGGYVETGHRCPGEWITVESMQVFLTHLLDSIEFDIPEQDLSFDLSRMPTLPKSGFVIKNVTERVPIEGFVPIGFS